MKATLTPRKTFKLEDINEENAEAVYEALQDEKEHSQPQTPTYLREAIKSQIPANYLPQDASIPTDALEKLIEELPLSTARKRPKKET